MPHCSAPPPLQKADWPATMGGAATFLDGTSPIECACMHRYLGFVLSLIVFAQAGAQRAAQSWQKIQSPTASQVAAAWQSPPPEYGPEPYYGLNGPVTIEQVERDLDTMKRLGFQAVTVQAGYNMPFAYLSPEYFAFFRKFVE